MTPATWYFDIISPFAYLQAMALPDLAARMDVAARPILLAAVLKHWGQLGPAEMPTKREFIYRQCLHRAEARGIPFRMPPAHPFNPLRALRLLTALDATPAQAAAALAFVFGQGRAVDDEAGAEALADHLGAPPEARLRAGSDETKAQLRRATEDAIAAGVFGVPTVLIGGHLFWGDDAGPMIQAHLDDPGRTATMAAGLDRPIAAARS